MGTVVTNGKFTVHLIQQVRDQKMECQQLLKEALGKALVLEVPEGEALAIA